MTPAVPENFQGMKDLVVRAPFWWMKKRPTNLFPVDSDRLGGNMLETVMQVPNNVLDPIEIQNSKE